MLPSIITYQNLKTKKTFFHIVDYYSLYDVYIGKKNGFGWYVLDIQIFYKGRFYTKNEFEKLIKKKDSILLSLLNKV